MRTNSLKKPNSKTTPCKLNFFPFQSLTEILTYWGKTQTRNQVKRKKKDRSDLWEHPEDKITREPWKIKDMKCYLLKN